MIIARRKPKVDSFSCVERRKDGEKIYLEVDYKRPANVSLWWLHPIDCFPNYCLAARRGKDLVAKGCYGPWRILLNANPPRFPVCYSV